MTSCEYKLKPTKSDIGRPVVCWSSRTARPVRGALSDFTNQLIFVRVPGESYPRAYHPESVEFDVEC